MATNQIIKKYKIEIIFSIILLIFTASFFHKMMTMPKVKDLRSITAEIQGIKCIKKSNRFSTLHVKAGIDGKEDFEVVKGYRSCFELQRDKVVGATATFLIAEEYFHAIWGIKIQDEVITDYNSTAKDIFYGQFVSVVLWYFIFIIVFIGRRGYVVGLLKILKNHSSQNQ